MKYSYLALGDSYTIGEQVPINQSFPYQTVQLLRKANLAFYAPEIIATTGWRTDDLNLAIDETILLPAYDFVSLLIGVNNQYEDRSVDEFRGHFRMLLEKVIRSAGGQASRVIVLSIPDWGVTPFALAKPIEKIRSEIELFNFICQAEAEYFQTHFIDITTSQRLDGHNGEFLAHDQLHPSGKEYFKWAQQLSDIILSVINKSM